jgi:CTP synthase
LVKYVIITGGVLSSVGKGTIAASTGLLLKSMNYSVTLIKIDPYLNVDAGTMNPYMHGEVYVTEDGGETDLDLGHYERFVDITMSKYNNITAGKVYFEVIRKERAGEYLGQTVQIIPHVTNQIKDMIRDAQKHSGAEIVIIEIGGTVGDIEGLPFLEATRELALEEGNVAFIHVALIEHLKATGELKTKPLQHSVQELRRIGIQPHIIVARSEIPLDEETKRKVALYTNLRPEHVFSSYDVDLVYEVPLILKLQGYDKALTQKLGIEYRSPDTSKWEDFVRRVKNAGRTVRIALVGKYTKLKDSYLSIKEAIIHASAHLGLKTEISWIEAENLETDENALNVLSSYNGIIVLPGFGARGAEGKIKAIKLARENNLSFLGICFGLQLSVVEFARNVVGLKNANSTEIDPNTLHPVVTILDDQKSVKEVGGTMRLGAQKIILKPGTLAYRLYGTDVVYERHRHRYEVNPKYVDLLQKHGMVISGVSDKGLVEFIEFPDHKFFLATQAHPEFKSRPLKPSPVFIGFLKAAAGL